ncbi:coiled-coil domain-containing protein [Thermococcus camini]|uniref:Uncharacterized protein n=1 Tax=Thermococcus camini TaxID=2016373 RepID=A0A7G2D6G1_9EURY|nr:hypothetical protein [Thermococcus camini]CAD5243484.1 conserved protein of unknown function [Thermococcus camini]
MRLEQALDEYDKRRKKAAKEAEKIRKKYNKRLEKKLREILKRIDSLERKEIPKNVDDNIRKIVTAERRNYVTSLRNALESIGDMDDLGKRLPDLAKLHVGHGRYLIILFEKDVYAINRLLKELNEDYVKYYNELAEKGLEDLRIREILSEEKAIRRSIEELTDEIRALREKAKKKRAKIEESRRQHGLEEVKTEIKILSARIRSEEMEVRSKASKLQKPVKRLRLHETIAQEFVGDSSVALRKPEEFISLMKKIHPGLEGKYRKTAEWLIDNLEERARRIEEERKKLAELEERRDEVLTGINDMEKELWELQRLIEERETELKKLRSKLEHLERELDDNLAKLEEILGESIER